MKTLSHVHVKVTDLDAAAAWFQRILQASPLASNERIVWLRFGDFGVILDKADADSSATLGFATDDCDRDYAALTERGAEYIESPADRPWGERVAYLKGPGMLVIELEQPAKQP